MGGAAVGEGCPVGVGAEPWLEAGWLAVSPPVGGGGGGSKPASNAGDTCIKARILRSRPLSWLRCVIASKSTVYTVVRLPP